MRKAPYRSPPPTLSLNKTQRTGLQRPRTHIQYDMGREGGVHFALGLDGRRRHGTDGRREDESEQESLRSLTHQKLEELQSGRE